MGGRRLRALALGDASGVRGFVQRDSALRLTEARRDARADLATLAALGARVISLADPAYPAGLRDLRSPPAFVCARGTVPAGGVAIVGSRDAGEAACAWAAAFAARAGMAVVSGLARGVDAAAHRGALAADRPQVAYVGTGLAHVYPPEHASLAAEIVARGGAIVSERLPDEPVRPAALVARDRLQAAHAVAVVLVESELDGGAMHALRAARILGRPRFVRASGASGNTHELAHGARALSPNVDDALSAFTHAISTTQGVQAVRRV